MDKMPWISQLRIGEIYCILWPKLVIKDCESQAKLLCDTSQLCAGLEAGIERTIHSTNQKINLANVLSFLNLICIL